MLLNASEMKIRQLSEELQRKAMKEINEVPTRIEEDVQHIREWLQKQPHLRVRDDDQTLVGFLRACKYRLQQTKEKIDSYYTIRTLLPDFFRNRDPFLPEIQAILDANLVAPLPSTEHAAGPRILMFRIQNCPLTTSPANLLKVCFMSIDILMKEDDNCMVSGLIPLSDYKGFPMSLAKQIDLGLLKKFALTTTQSYPIRIKAVHYFNVPTIITTFYNMIKSLAPDKMKRRIFLYTADDSNIKKEILQSVLPTEYGGDAGHFEDMAAAWRAKVEGHRQWFLEDEMYRTDEKLRPGKPKTNFELFGIEGSFRKMDID